MSLSSDNSSITENSVESDIIECSNSESKINVHLWCDRFLNQYPLYSKFIFLNGAILIWCSTRLNFDNFSLSLKSKFDNEIITTELFGSSELAQIISRQIAKQFNCIVLTSIDMTLPFDPNTDIFDCPQSSLEEWCQSRITQEINQCQKIGMFR